MPHNHLTYRLNLHPEYTHALDSAIGSENGVFIPCDSPNHAASLALLLNRHRRAYEVQMSDNLKERNRYSMIKIGKSEHDGVLGVLLKEIEGTEALTIIEL
jgi:hypothetical protein